MCGILLMIFMHHACNRLMMHNFPASYLNCFGRAKLHDLSRLIRGLEEEAIL